MWCLEFIKHLCGVKEMRSFKIKTETVTYAIKGREILRKNGFKARIEKSGSQNGRGCSYVIEASGSGTAETILRKAGIKFSEIEEI